MKELILTIDYELFLGKNTGSVESCMIEPTKQLSDFLSYNSSKMTVFWDILHFYKLIELETIYSELKKDRIAIQNQIIDLAGNGHDIQLHLHPHWLDATFVNGKWQFSYERFKLHSLSKSDNPKDINTIIGCVTIAKELMRQIVRKIDKEYNVFSFRAGGYLVEPFNEICEALYKNGIYIDSSVCPELKNDSNVFSYDFANYPSNIFYRTNSNISKISNEGKFIEIPITSIKVSLLRRVYFTLLKRIKYKKIESVKKGSGSGNYYGKTKSSLQKIKSFVYGKKYQKLTTDNSFEEKYSYLLKKAKNNSTQILHPKMLNEHTLNVLKTKLKENKIKFISVKEFINKKN